MLLSWGAEGGVATVDAVALLLLLSEGIFCNVVIDSVFQFLDCGFQVADFITLAFNMQYMHRKGVSFSVNSSKKYYGYCMSYLSISSSGLIQSLVKM